MKATSRQKQAFRTLFAEILAKGKALGTFRTKKELAMRLGLRAETLSRMPKSGNGDFATLQSMARMTGYRLALVPDDDRIERIQKGEFF